MLEKKVLIVTQSFYPENSPRSHRATELTKCLSRLGHKITVICPKSKRIHDQFSRDFNVDIIDIGNTTWKPISLKGNRIIYWLRRILRRICQMAIVYPDIQLVWLVNKALRNEKEYDLMVSIAVPYPIHWGVAYSRSKNNRIANIWIADCGDPFMGQENDTFKYPFYFKYVEKWFCRKADYLTVPTEGSIAGYYPEFHNKIKVIPQGFDFDEVFPQGNIIQKGGKISFVYGGLFIPGRRDPRELLDYLSSIDLDFSFYIFTASTNLVEPYAKADSRIILHSPVPRINFIGELMSADFVVNFDNIGSKQTPSKLIDYAIVDKPILTIKTGSLDKKTVFQFLNKDYSGRIHLEDVDKYRIENVTNQFLKLSEK